MAAKREECFAALYAILEGLTAADERIFKFTSRVFQSWDETPPPQCPALFMVKDSEEVLPTPLGMPPLWRLPVRVVMYFRNDQGRLVAPSTQINQTLTAFELALQRKPTEPPPRITPSFLPNPPGTWGTSLGGLCYSCQIAGQLQVFEGTIGDGAMVIAYVDILTSA